MADGCEVHYRKKAVRIDPAAKEVFFADGTSVRYTTLVSTLRSTRFWPWRVSAWLRNRTRTCRFWCLTSAQSAGQQCPADHWLYNPDAHCGLHRVGFYSNVDAEIIPASDRQERTHISFYVERAFRGGDKPAQEAVAAYAASVVSELQSWGFIGQVEVMDPTWIDVAYTYSWPGSPLGLP